MSADTAPPSDAFVVAVAAYRGAVTVKQTSVFNDSAKEDDARVFRAYNALLAAHAADVAAAYAMGAAVEGEASACAGCGEPLGELCFACNDDARDPDHDAMTADRAHWRQRAELAESRLAAMNASRIAADDAARAKRDAFVPAPTERDRRGVPLGTGAGVGGADL